MIQPRLSPACDAARRLLSWCPWVRGQMEKLVARERAKVRQLEQALDEGRDLPAARIKHLEGELARTTAAAAAVAARVGERIDGGMGAVAKGPPSPGAGRAALGAPARRVRNVSKRSVSGRARVASSDSVGARAGAGDEAGAKPQAVVAHDTESEDERARQSPRSGVRSGPYGHRWITVRRGGWMRGGSSIAADCLDE